MRIAELSRRTGVPTPTIKYYVRAGLLPPGERTSYNQAQYDERHIHRLRLVRALIETGGLSVTTAREVLAKLDTPGISVLDSIGKVQFAMTAPPRHVHDQAREAAGKEVDALVERRGWHSVPTNPARQTLASVLATLRRLDQAAQLEQLLDAYAEAAERIAEAEVNTLLEDTTVDSLAERVVIWTALGDVLLSAVRRIAQESAATARLASNAPETARDLSAELD
jgi:DNA-binding transcriptional MerR regulator